MGELGERTAPSGTRSRRVWRPLLGLLSGGVGLYLTVRLTSAMIYSAEGYSPGDADCDDCGVTLLLDNIGWLALAVLAYLLLVASVVWILNRLPSSGAG